MLGPEAWDIETLRARVTSEPDNVLRQQLVEQFHRLEDLQTAIGFALDKYDAMADDYASAIDYLRTFARTLKKPFPPGLGIPTEDERSKTRKLIEAITDRRDAAAAETATRLMRRPTSTRGTTHHGE